MIGFITLDVLRNDGRTHAFNIRPELIMMWCADEENNDQVLVWFSPHEGPWSVVIEPEEFTYLLQSEALNL